ncbi:B3 domain-containing protein Os01g0905400-like [Phalaenopsis equestris]|uniref:B3 domain-containing protein Os01g0905400-like n=1 Tax=Phalaenopsis equestris TaxID=78828 RepID=UPI0009E5B608|nr:B3 domain-containing protein Os01g0905400-like [Phalaenopsis equestris]XP_020590306.1 B3 domain-containing protein Os01g0905400-like [Phalaenopsis equestris]
MSAEFDFPKALMIESDSKSEGVLELSSAGEKPLYDSNPKKSDITVHDSEETFPRNSDAIVGELNAISPTEVVNSDIENIDVVASKIIRNTMNTTGKGVPLLPSKQTVEEPDAMTKTATWVVKAHSDIKEESVEMCGSLMQLNKEHDEMRNNEKVDQEHSYDHEMLDCELHDDKMASLTNLEHAECSLKMGFNKIKPEGIADFFVSADGICHTTLDEKLIELATGPSCNTNGHEKPLCQNDHATFHLETGVPCETISAVSSNPTLDHTDEKNINLLSISEEYEVPQTKGSSTIAESGLQSCKKFPECFVKENDRQTGCAHDAFFDEDEKNVTPCSSWICKLKTDRTDSADIPSSSCVSFSVCLSDDVQSSLEFQSKLSCQIVKLKHKRKIVVLQDPSMRCWPVLYHKSNSFVGFLGGWVDFAKANNICRGDICEFELINKLEYKFRVQIMKAEGSICDEKVA